MVPEPGYSQKRPGTPIIHNQQCVLGCFAILLNCATQGYSRTTEIMDPSEIAALIEAGLPGASVRVLTDDNTHFEAIIVAEAFDGKRPMQRHQLIYECLGTLMGNEIHALSIRAHTPGEWSKLESASQA